MRQFQRQGVLGQAPGTLELGSREERQGHRLCARSIDLRGTVPLCASGSEGFLRAFAASREDSWWGEFTDSTALFSASLREIPPLLHMDTAQVRKSTGGPVVPSPGAGFTLIELLVVIEVRSF